MFNLSQIIWKYRVTTKILLQVVRRIGIAISRKLDFNTQHRWWDLLIFEIKCFWNDKLQKVEIYWRYVLELEKFLYPLQSLQLIL